MAYPREWEGSRQRERVKAQRRVQHIYDGVGEELDMFG